MIRKISTLDVRHNLGNILDQVSLRSDQYVIERKGKPLAAVIPIWQFDKLKDQRQMWFQTIQNIHEQNRDIPGKEIDSAIDEAIAVVRKRKKK